MHHKQDNDTHVFFYEQEFYVLSNFSAFSIETEGYIFPTSEHLYHHQKFNYYCKDDPLKRNLLENIKDIIREAPSAHDAFRFARELDKWKSPNWQTEKRDVMKYILYLKIDQHPYVRKKLLETGNRELIEDS